MNMGMCTDQVGYNGDDIKLHGLSAACGDTVA